MPNRPGNGAVSLPEVPGYEVLSEIGRGGMGVIHTKFDRRGGISDGRD